MRRIWTRDEIKYLKQNYADVNTSVVAAHLGRSKGSVFGMVQILGLTKSEIFKASPLSGRLRPGAKIGGSFRFKKGHTSWNKGKKLGNTWGSERSRATRFKKGDLPHNTKTDGEISIRNSKGRSYKWQRISLAKWKEVHRLVWEKHNGPIPKGVNVQFKDGDSLNCVIENLYLVDRHNQMLDNSIHRYPENLQSTMLLVGKLKRKIKQHEKHNN